MDKPELEKWEMFPDPSYCDMFAVRPKGDTNFNSPRLFHFSQWADACLFKQLCEKANIAIPAPPPSVEEIRERFRKEFNEAGFHDENGSVIPVWIFEFFLPYIKGDAVDEESVIKNCQAELLKHLFNMVHQNGYPAKAVPQAIILELDKLMKNNKNTTIPGND